jgi:catechol 2,3-dioxygenase-like lactoylglutathione lyase family enzyme
VTRDSVDYLPTVQDASLGDLKLAKVGLLILGVRDMARSLPFYRDKLGLTVQFETPGFAFLDGGGVTLCLSEPVARNSEHLVGATEVVFAVRDVAQAYAALRERGVEFFQPPRNVNGSDWAANFRDPDGHGLSVYGPPGDTSED